MRFLRNILLFTAFVSISTESASAQTCTINNFTQVSSVVSTCTEIVIDNLLVPAGVTLELDLQKGTTLTFVGNTSFQYIPWSGPLIRVKGSNITIQGKTGSVLDGQGPRYWDGKGDKGPKKPQFMKIEVDEDSVIRNIKVLNCPHHCIYIGKSDGLTISGWLIDVSAGDMHNFTGHNTDGFDISAGNNVIIENTTVLNQDDCIAIRYGTNITVRNMYCSGGHGLSLSVGFNKTSFAENVVSNVLFENSTVVNSANAIHLKTHTDGYYGVIRNITYRNLELIGIKKVGVNIQQDYAHGGGTGTTRNNVPIIDLTLSNIRGTMKGITNYGINIQQDYANGESTGIAKDNIPIIDLTLSNINGVLNGNTSIAFRVICGEGACLDWKWSAITIGNASLENSCNYSPSDFPCM